MDDSLLTPSSPSLAAWRRHTESILLSAGGVLMIAGVMGLIANSHSNVLSIMPVMLLQLALIVMSVIAFKVRNDKIKFDLCLLSNTLIAFGMLTLIYSNFENALTLWLLFSIWTCIITPWAISAYTGMIWLFWIAGLNLSLVSIYVSLRSQQHIELSVFIMVCNVIFLIVWEILSRKTQVFNTRAGSRFVAFLSLAGATSLAYFCIYHLKLPFGLQVISVIPWLTMVIVFMCLWGRNGKDIFISAITALYLAVALPCAVGYLLFSHSQIPGSFSFFSLLIGVPILIILLLLWLKKCFKNRVIHAN